MSVQDSSTPWTAAIFALVYVALALGKVPGLRIDRAGIALVGAAAMLAAGVLSFGEAAAAVDMQTIVLLTGMMIVAGYLQVAGFFEIVTGYLASRFQRPHALLAAIIVLSGTLSAVLVNDVVCVALTPLVIGVCQRLGRASVPYLIGLATASNIGSVATITGNPQNMIIGSLSGISYLRFTERLAPIALIGLVLDYVVVAWVYRRTLAGSSTTLRPTAPYRPRHVHRAALAKGVMVTLATVALFLAGQPIAIVALAAAGVLLLDRIRPAKLYRLVDWPLLVMFAGLFVVVRAFEIHVVRGWHLERWTAGAESPVTLISGLSLALSNLVSNVPAVLLFEPVMAGMPDAEQAWLALSMSSTLAGNLTLLGSVANLIVAESARRAGTEVRFGEYLKVGVILTVLTTVVGIVWLSWT